jgi:hypothetical protein
MGKAIKGIKQRYIPSQGVEEEEGEDKGAEKDKNWKLHKTNLLHFRKNKGWSNMHVDQARTGRGIQGGRRRPQAAPKWP